MAGHLLRSNWAVARREEGASPQWAVTDEQRSHSPISAQPEGRQFFFAETSLLTPYRSLGICSSLAPRLRKKSLAANVQLFRRHHISCGACGKWQKLNLNTLILMAEGPSLAYVLPVCPP